MDACDAEGLFKVWQIPPRGDIQEANSANQLLFPRGRDGKSVGRVTVKELSCFHIVEEQPTAAIAVDVPPPPVSVGPNFSHHKARVQAVGWFPVGDQEIGEQTFCSPPPTPTGTGTKWATNPTQPPPPTSSARGTPFAPSLHAGKW